MKSQQDVQKPIWGTATGAQISAVLYLIAVVLSVWFNVLKLNALGFHTRDFPFYLQFAAKLFDPALSNVYSMNPDGYNFLGYDGVEGMRSLLQTIHFEPIKWLFAALYWLTGTPVAIFVFQALIFFLPPLYLAYGQKGKSSNQSPPLRGRVREGAAYKTPTGTDTNAETALFVLAIALLYILFPSTILALADDLRPYTLLAPTFALTILSIHLRRPFWETLLFFNLIFFCREESIVLAIPILGYHFFRSHSHERFSRLMVLIGNWLLWILAILSYFWWTGYALNDFLNPLAPVFVWLTPLRLMLILGGFFVIIVSVMRFLARRENSWAQELENKISLQILSYAVIFAPLVWQAARSKGRKFLNREFSDAAFSFFKDIVLFPKFTLFFVATVVLSVLLWELMRSQRQRRVMLTILSLLVIACLYLQSVPWMKTPAVMAGRYRASIVDSALVVALRDSTNKYQSHILADYRTYQAFYDYENIFVYERLPWALVPGEERRFPQNQAVLQTLLAEQIEYIAFAKDQDADDESEKNLLALLDSMNVEPIERLENDQFMVIRLR